MKNRLRSINQRGDTIVEVLVVLAVLSLAFSIAYATATHGLNQSRNAEEHSQALGVLNAQVELVREAVSKDAHGLPASGSFCVSNNDVTQDSSFTSTSVAGSCTSGFYKMSVTPVGSVSPQAGFYDFKVQWPGLGSLGPQQEEITYRIQPLVATAYSAPALLPASPTIQVTVQRIAPNSDNTSSALLCSSSNTVSNYDVSSVNINGPNDNQSSPTSGGVATFPNLKNDSGTYTVAIAVPANYNACSVSQATTVQSGKTSSVTMKVWPNCYANPVTYKQGPPIYGPAYYHTVTPNYDWTRGAGPYTPPSGFYPTSWFPGSGPGYHIVNPYPPGSNSYYWFDWGGVWGTSTYFWAYQAVWAVVSYSYSDYSADIIGYTPIPVYSNSCY